MGPHSDQALETEFWKSSTVSNAKTGIEKEEKRVKTAADFNREEEEKAKRA